jgi:hypothetical protein
MGPSASRVRTLWYVYDVYSTCCCSYLLRSNPSFCSLWRFVPGYFIKGQKTTATTQCTSVSSSTAWETTISSFPLTLDVAGPFRADEEDLLEKQFIVSGVQKARAAAALAAATSTTQMDDLSFEVDFDSAFSDPCYLDPGLLILPIGTQTAEI